MWVLVLLAPLNAAPGRQGAGRAPCGSVNHSPHLLCLKTLPGDSSVHPCLHAPCHWDEIQEPMSEVPVSRHPFLCIMPTLENNFWP